MYTDSKYMLNIGYCIKSLER